MSARRNLVRFITIALVGGLVPLIAHANPAGAVPASCVDSGRAATDAATATARAKLCGTQVEDGSARSETGQVFVHPDGTATSIEYATPVRVHRPDVSCVDPVPSLVPNPDRTFSLRAATLYVTLAGHGNT